MKYQLNCDDFAVSYYDGIQEIRPGTDVDTYHVVPADTLDTAVTEELAKQGFQFLDRILKMEIDIAATKEHREKRMEKLMSFPVELSDTVSEEMYDLACLVFDTDRRFHLRHGFDSVFSAKVLRAYVDFYNEKDIFTFQVRYKGELAGFTVVHRQESFGENVLGVTKPGILGKMAAYGMYAGMIDYMYEQENYKTYYAEVSSCNAASMNLHMQLGAKVTGNYDKFIYREVK